MKTGRMAIWALVLGLLVFNLVRGAISLQIIPLNDFIEYWAAGGVFLGGGNPYSAEELLAVQRTLGWGAPEPLMMWNPPWTLPLVAPLALMPYWVARGVWFVLHLVLLFACADWLWRYYGGRREQRWVAWLIVPFFVPDVMALSRGQIAPLVFGGMVGFLWCLSRGRPGLAGVSLLLPTIKPHLLYIFWIFLLWWIVVERQWKLLAALFLSVLTGTLLAVARNEEVIGQYLHAIRSDQGPLRWETPSLGTALRLAFDSDSRFLELIPVLGGLIVAAWFWHRWKNGFEWRDRLPEIILLSVVTTGFSWSFDWVVLLPPVILMMARFASHPGRNWWLLAGLVLLQGGVLLQLSRVQNYFYTVWVPPALALLYACCALRNREAIAPPSRQRGGNCRENIDGMYP